MKVVEGKRAIMAGRWGGVRGWGLGGGPHADGVLLSSLPAMVNTTGGGAGLAFGGTMGSNALRFSRGGGPGTLKAYSIRNTTATRRRTLN